MLCNISTVQIQPRKCALDHAHYMRVPIRQHQLLIDHAHQGMHLSCLADLDHEVIIGDLDIVSKQEEIPMFSNSLWWAVGIKLTIPKTHVFRTSTRISLLKTFTYRCCHQNEGAVHGRRLQTGCLSRPARAVGYLVPGTRGTCNCQL